MRFHEGVGAEVGGIEGGFGGGVGGGGVYMVVGPRRCT